jgi:hypothetical protein
MSHELGAHLHRLDGVVPRVGLAALAEGRDEHPTGRFADLEEGFDRIEAVDQQTDRPPGERGPQSGGQSAKGVEFAVLLLADGVVEILELAHQVEDGVGGSDQFGFQHITIAGKTRWSPASPVHEGAVDRDAPIPSQQPGAVEQAHAHEPLDQQKGQPVQGGGGNAFEMMGDVLGAGDGAPRPQAIFVPQLVAERQQVGGH